MKFLHISDLHIGKRLHERSFLEDQKYILKEILSIAKTQKVDALLLAGDIYDKNVPTEKGVMLFDEFLTECKRAAIKIFLISGNHDSSERIHFGGRIMEESGIYIQGRFEGKLSPIRLEDKYGSYHVYLLPFVRPALVKPYLKGETENAEEQLSCHMAVQKVLEQVEKDDTVTNILVAHQFVTAGGMEPERCESESISVGGLDNVDVSVFAGFDYVALGHLHMPQQIGKEHVYYSGSPLKYSFSEAEVRGVNVPEKSVLLITAENGISVQKIPLKPLRDMRVLRGKLEDLLKPEAYEKANTEDYVRVILTDEEELYEPMKQLRKVYPNILRLDFDNSRTRIKEGVAMSAEAVEEKSAIELFGEFYEKQNNNPLSNEQSEVIKKIWQEVTGQ